MHESNHTQTNNQSPQNTQMKQKAITLFLFEETKLPPDATETCPGAVGMLGTALGGTVASGGKQNPRSCAQHESIFQKKNLSLRELNFVLQSQYKHKLQAINDFFPPPFSENLNFEFGKFITVLRLLDRFGNLADLRCLFLCDFFFLGIAEQIKLPELKT